VRALTRVAQADDEAELLELAQGSTTAQLERMVRAWKKGSRKDEAEWEQERHRSRKFAVFPDDNGMYVVTGRLTPEVGALLMRAVEAASDALFRERSVPGLTDDVELEPAQRRADAVGLLAERALAAGFGAAVACGCEGIATAAAVVTAETPDVAASEAECGCSAGRGCPAPAAPLSGTRAERYQVVLHVEPATLSADGEPGRSELEDGTRVSSETSRRLSCDASLVRVSRGERLDPRRGAEDPHDLGRTPPRARGTRRGCRFPAGCVLRTRIT
jgi:hypothetical protein